MRFILTSAEASERGILSPPHRVNALFLAATTRAVSFGREAVRQPLPPAPLSASGRGEESLVFLPLWASGRRTGGGVLSPSTRWGVARLQLAEAREGAQTVESRVSSDHPLPERGPFVGAWQGIESLFQQRQRTVLRAGQRRQTLARGQGRVGLGRGGDLGKDRGRQPQLLGLAFPVGGPVGVLGGLVVAPQPGTGERLAEVRCPTLAVPLQRGVEIAQGQLRRPCQQVDLAPGHVKLGELRGLQ